jgi:glycosyltransferase involved in cell wall biosynthesis
MQRRGAVLLFDYDDALFIHKPSRYNPLATFLRAPGKVVELFGLVDCVVAGNDWLRDEALRLGAARAVTVEVAEDTGRIRPRMPEPEAPLTIGWLGSTSTVKYLQLIAPVLRDIAQRHPQVRFEIMGGGEFSMPGVPWVLSAWSLEAELAALARFDIGLMPLPMEDWAKGKSGGKARTYMAAGVVPVCADIGYNRELIRDGETGYLCADDTHWRDALETLIASADLRRKVASAARAEVERRFAPDAKAQELKHLFDALCGRNAVG